MQSGLGSKGDNGGGRTHNVTQMNGHTQERERTHSVTKRTDTQGGCTQNVTQRTKVVQKTAKFPMDSRLSANVPISREWKSVSRKKMAIKQFCE